MYFVNDLWYHDQMSRQVYAWEKALFDLETRICLCRLFLAEEQWLVTQGIPTYIPHLRATVRVSSLPELGILFPSLAQRIHV